MKYMIKLMGCDDTTRFEMELSDEQVAVVQQMADLSKKTSECGCMPVLEFEKV